MKQKNGSVGRRRSRHGETGKTGSKKARVIYSADFETKTSEPTWVWSWGVINITDPDESPLEWGTEIESFIDKCMEANSLMQFFNLKFDGHFIIDWLLHNGFKHVETERNRGLKRKEFSTLMSHTGKLYTMTVKWENGHTTEFRDAAKKFPAMSVATVAKAFKMNVSKGDLDYHKERPKGYVPDEDEIDYLDRDVRIVAKALRETMDSGMTKITVGADALAEYKRTIGGETRFRNLFPLLSDEMDAEIRRAYRGGFTYLAKRFKGRRCGAGIVLDVNSLYPSVMYNELIPYGMPQFKKGKVTPDERYPLTIFSVTFTAKLKKDHVPCIQIKGSSIFGATEYLESIEEPTTLMVTNVDWDLWNEHYDIEVQAWGGGWRFKAAKGLFKEYIDKWSKIKETTTGGQKQIAKSYLNNLYGKFASNPNVTGKVPILDDEDKVRYVRGKEATKDPIYTAAGVFITSHARALTIRAAQKSYAVFAYADTDSLHLLTDEVPEGIDIDPVRMGAWKFEYAFKEAHYVRAKVYLERIADENEHEEECDPGCKLRHDYKTAFAGLPQGVAGSLTFDDIREGAVFNGKLQPRSVRGGVILEEKTFTLKF